MASSSDYANWYSAHYAEPLIPQDGTIPFYLDAWVDKTEYDSDDEFKTVVEIEEWDAHGSQIVPPTSSLVSTDKRFILVSHVPEPRRTLACRGFAVQGADTIISLSPDDADSLLLPSSLLAQSHPFFEAAFGGRWASNRLETGPKVVNERATNERS
ncbi:hypothetical protein LTR36_001162, partial [Oleoguttula mirabilis]